MWWRADCGENTDTPAADSISILPSDERGAPIAADIKHYVNMINAGADLLQEHYTARWDSPIVWLDLFDGITQNFISSSSNSTFYWKK